jgi:hypothetical protein
MRCHVHGDIERAGRPATWSGLAVTRETDLVAFVDPGRDRHAERPLSLGPTLAEARLARVLDDPALAAAAGTRVHVDHLAEHRLAHRPELAAAVALRTRDRRRALLCTRPAAGLAPGQRVELDLLLGPGDGLLERDPEVVAEVGARLRAPTSDTRRGATEERIEDVAEAAEAGPEPEVALATQPGPAEHVVRLATLRIGQDLVCLVDLLEPLGCRRILVDVGMPLLGKAAECLLDVVV